MTSLYEGIPMVLLEAMALKKAVVGFAVGGIKEVIKDNVSGILIEPKNIDAFFKTCLKVLDNRELKDNLGNNARKRIEEEFSSPVQKERILEFYQKLAGRK
jgi:glycosyltransferase involved in cell wall biosynthesis